MGDVKVIQIFTDGGSRGNPGPAAIGVYIIDDDGNVLLKLGKQIGVATNNIAEYAAVIEALLWIKNESDLSADFDLIYNFYLDSSLVVNQLNGIFKVKDLSLKKLAVKAKNLEKEIKGKISYQHIPREKNKTADFLLNKSF